MKIPIIKVGNSKGIRIPKNILEQYAIGDRVEMQLSEQGIILKPIAKARDGWSQKFAAMHELGDDELLMDDVFTDETFDW